MPEIKVQGKISNFFKKEPEKFKHTNILLTINTNQRYQDNDANLQNDVEVFDGTVQNILNNINNYCKFPDGDNWNDNSIKDVSIDYIVEKGTQKNCIHAHALVKIKHNTKLQLDFKKIQEKVNTELGIVTYVNGRLVKNNGSDNIVDYLNKYA